VRQIVIGGQVKYLRNPLIFVFGFALVCSACSAAQLRNAEKRLIDGTRNVQNVAGSVANGTPPGSGVHEWSLLVTAMAGGILAIDKLLGGVASLTPGNRQKAEAESIRAKRTILRNTKLKLTRSRKRT
jgi:hypothetical protein